MTLVRLLLSLSVRRSRSPVHRKRHIDPVRLSTQRSSCLLEVILRLVFVEIAMNQSIYIRIRNTLLLPIPSSNASANLTPFSPPLTGHLYLIEGTYEDIQRYAGTTVDWIIKVAHLICDPLGKGQLFTHMTGTPSDWYHLNKTPNRKRVVQGEPLRPGIYEFELTSPILLSKITEWGDPPLTTSESGSESSESSAIALAYHTFANHIELRERGACAVSNMRLSFYACHLVATRLGSDGVKEVIARFSGEKTAHGI